MKCKFCSICEYFTEASATCTDGGYPYCGAYQRLNESHICEVCGETADTKILSLTKISYRCFKHLNKPTDFQGLHDLEAPQ